MKKFVAEVYRRKTIDSQWKRTKDLIIYAKTEKSAWNKFDKAGKILTNDYCQIRGHLKEIKNNT